MHLAPMPRINSITRFGIKKEVFLKSRIIGMPLYFSSSSVRWHYTIKGHLAIFIGQIPCCCRSPWDWQHSQSLLLSTSDTLLFVVFGILDLDLSTLKYVGGLSVAFEAPGCSSEPLDLISISVAWAHSGPMQSSILLFHQLRNTAHNWERYPRKSLWW